MQLSGYRCMWLIALFDLPTDTKDARRAYALFRKQLLEDGFAMMQYSVYVRNCPSHENAKVHIRRVKSFLPGDGEVRLILITDKQYERMMIFWGRKRRQPEPAPTQLAFF